MLDLKNNPFNILGVSPRDDVRFINNAYQDAIIDFPEQKGELLDARQSIIIAQRRVGPELRWFPGTSDETIKTVTSEIDKVNGFDFSSFEGLAKANLIAHHHSSIERAERLLAHAVDDLIEDDVRDVVNIDRAKAGLPEIPKDAFRLEWKKLQLEYVECALDMLTSRQNPGNAMLDLVEDHLADQEIQGKFTKMLAIRFDEWSRPVLNDIEARIRLGLSSLGDQEIDERTFRGVVADLNEWDSYRQPIQLLADNLDIDDTRSLELFNDVTHALIQLSSQQGNISFARRCCDVLHDVFQEIPTARESISNLRDQIEREASLSSLSELVDENLENLGSLATSVDKGQFKSGGRAPAGKLYASFINARDLVVESKQEIPWALMMQLVPAFAKENYPPNIVMKFVDVLCSLKPPSVEIGKVLNHYKADLRKALRIVQHEKIVEQINQELTKGNHFRALELASDGLKENPTEHYKKEYEKMMNQAFQIMSPGNNSDNSSRHPPRERYEPPHDDSFAGMVFGIAMLFGFIGLLQLLAWCSNG